MTKELKDKVYQVYHSSYSEAVSEVMHGKDIAEANKEESLKILDLLCDKIQNSNEISNADIQEFILDRLIESL